MWGRISPLFHTRYKQLDALHRLSFLRWKILWVFAGETPIPSQHEWVDSTTTLQNHWSFLSLQRMCIEWECAVSPNLAEDDICQYHSKKFISAFCPIAYTFNEHYLVGNSFCGAVHCMTGCNTSRMCHLNCTWRNLLLMPIAIWIKLPRSRTAWRSEWTEQMHFQNGKDCSCVKLKIPVAMNDMGFVSSDVSLFCVNNCSYWLRLWNFHVVENELIFSLLLNCRKCVYGVVCFWITISMHFIFLLSKHNRCNDGTLARWWHATHYFIFGSCQKLFSIR